MQPAAPQHAVLISDDPDQLNLRVTRNDILANFQECSAHFLESETRLCELEAFRVAVKIPSNLGIKVIPWDDFALLWLGSSL